MAETMMAAVVRSFGAPLTIERVPIPKPGPGEVLVRVLACGVCHTDLHAADGDWPVKPAPPFIPGHEGAGTVATLGEGVRGVAIGDRVGVPWLHDACGHCEHCITGWETLCAAQHDTGYSVDGGFAEYAIARADYLARLPDELSFADAAPVLCAGVTTYKGLKETEARPGQWVVISGIGGLGHMAVQYACAMGMRVAAIDVAPAKLELAKQHGAELLIDASKQDPGAAVQKAIGGAHAALVTAVSPRAMTTALSTLRSGGTCVVVGLPPGDFPMPIFDMVLKRLTVRGSIVGTRMDMQEALAFAATRKVHATISRMPLAQVNDAFAGLRKGTLEGRVVLDMGA
jgi:propanol-preferring alcohol dehydrogenase